MSVQLNRVLRVGQMHDIKLDRELRPGAMGNIKMQAENPIELRDQVEEKRRSRMSRNFSIEHSSRKGIAWQLYQTVRARKLRVFDLFRDV